MLSPLIKLSTHFLVAGRVVRIMPPFVCLLLGSFEVLAQYRFESWTTENGLPQNSVTQVIQTRDGYLWLATFDGLVRFDGVRFTIFDKNNSKGFSSNRLLNLFEDKDGALWISTEDAGVMRYARGAFSSFSIKDGLRHNRVFEVEADHQGGLQIMTEGGYNYWRENRLWPDADHTDSTVFKRYHAPSGAVWTSDRKGLRRIKDGNETVYPLLIKPDDIKIVTLYEDRQGSLWLGGTTPALFKIRDGVVKRYLLPEGAPGGKNIQSFCDDRQGNLWIGTAGAGLMQLKDERFTIFTKKDGLSDNNIRDIFVDGEDNLWIGTNTAGLYRLTRTFISTFALRNGLHNNNVYPIYQDRAGDIWIGATDILSRYRDGKIVNYTKTAGVGAQFQIQSLAEDRLGQIWVGSYSGLEWFKDSKFTAPPGIISSGAIWAIHEDRSGNLWFGAERGLYKYKDGVTAVYDLKDGLPSRDVKMIHEDRRGDLWFGTYGGLAKLTNGQFTSYTERDGLASNRVRYIYEDAEGIFWIGTYDGGLSRFKNGRFTNYNVQNGLYNNGVFQILEDAHGMFWMGCNKGIYRVSKQQLNEYADDKISSIICTAYGKEDGMLNAECNGGRQPAGLRARDGRLWFPTQGGAVVIDPEAAPLNARAPPVQIESVLLDKDSVDFRDEVRIKTDRKYLEITYTGLTFIKSDQAQFKYQLVGQDNRWQDAGTRRTVYYSYLPPGHYTFKVIAANSDGIWNTTGASLRIYVVPPFWRTWWFNSAAVITLIGLATLVYRRRVARFKQAYTAKEAFSRQLLDSQERERQRIAAELHDSLGQSLLIIKNRAFLALGSIDDQEETHEQLEEISSSAAHAIEEVREIAYNLRPYQISRFGLTRTLEAIADKASETSSVHFSTRLDPIDGIFPAEAETNIFRIVQESINNIIRHSHATEAGLMIQRQAREVILKIEDNGRGFAIADRGSRVAENEPVNEVAAGNPQSPIRNPKSGGFGLIGIAERARMLGGKYEIESAPGLGVKITIILTAPEKNNEK